MSKYLKFSEHTSASGKTAVIIVSSAANDAPLGVINWYSSWRRYVFHPANDTLFDNECLKEISRKIMNLTALRLKKLNDATLHGGKPE